VACSVPVASRRNSLRAEDLDPVRGDHALRALLQVQVTDNAVRIARAVIDALGGLVRRLREASSAGIVVAALRTRQFAPTRMPLWQLAVTYEGLSRLRTQRLGSPRWRYWYP
jgi:hypothetical protein